MKNKFNIQNTELDLPEIQSLDIEEIAKKKAEEAFFKEVGLPVLVEDSGLYIKDLNNFPGPLIKWLVESVGSVGIANIVNSCKSRRAFAKTVFCYYDRRGPQTFSGEISGRIADAPRGNSDFGWDPIFIPDGYTKTFTEMSPEEKNKISHRQRALLNLEMQLKIA